ncbi:hypothetical protein HMPREF9543_01870 [Escherichia coli MS 146-1]|nr:hypothetical protein HMPREF9543_01870 [Escherichia coli MS 146-1]
MNALMLCCCTVSRYGALFILLLPDINTRRIRRTTYKNGKKHPTSPLISWRCRSPE